MIRIRDELKQSQSNLLSENHSVAKSSAKDRIKMKKLQSDRKIAGSEKGSVKINKD